MSKNLKSIYLVATILLLSACSGPAVRNAIPQADKDPSGSYDGNYALIVKHPGGRQQLTGNWFANCNSRDFKINFSVKDSELSIRWGKDTTLQGYVDREGRFRVTSGVSSKVNVIGGIASDGSISVVVQGVLDDEVMKGRLIYAQKMHVGRGCTFPITYKKTG